ncbi:putative sulfate exporter family transporter [Micromonospora sp. NPDC047548]|uniref:YeiH family protein n=1 Tax=Micromonospora sp. NPDC047548 TaxID=3155624 RepID=UPI00340AD55C
MLNETASRQAPVPVGADPTPHPAEEPRPSRRERWVALGPGVALCAGAAGVALVGGLLLPTVSPLLIAIVLGAALCNVVRLPAVFSPGLAFAAKRLLRLGIVLLGLQLVLSDILRLGSGMIAVVVVTVLAGLVGTMFIGRLLGISVTQRLLIACGFSICGAAAVAAADGVVDAEEEEVVTAVALVVIFGTLMIPAVPLAAEALGLSTTQTGLWAGGSIHEVAQVVAVGGTVGGAALSLAVVVKLARVLLLAPVITVLSLRQRRMRTSLPAGGKRPPVIPLFVVGFLAMAALRTTGLLPGAVLTGARTAQTALLAAAMFALGCGVRVQTLSRVGVRPFLLASGSTAVVAGVSLVGVLAVT